MFSHFQPKTFFQLYSLCVIWLLGQAANVLVLSSCFLTRIVEMGCCCGQRAGGKVGGDREKNSIRARPEKLLGFWPRPRNHQQWVRPVILGLHDITINIGQNYLREHYPSDKTKQQTKCIYWVIYIVLLGLDSVIIRKQLWYLLLKVFWGNIFWFGACIWMKLRISRYVWF